MVTINLTRVPLNDGVQMPATVALDGEGAKIVFNESDVKTLILVENTGASAATITFKMGTGLQGVADLVKSIPAAKTQAFVLESGRFKKGGHVFVTGATTTKIAALLLP